MERSVSLISEIPCSERYFIYLLKSDIFAAFVVLQQSRVWMYLRYSMYRTSKPCGISVFGKDGYKREYSPVSLKSSNVRTGLRSMEWTGRNGLYRSNPLHSRINRVAVSMFIDIMFSFMQ